MSTRQQAAEERRHQIIEAALRVFSRKGFQKATNKDIADEAGVASPGLIYHYFQDKQDLFLSVLATYSPALKLTANAEMWMQEPPEVVLPQVAQTLLQTMRHPHLNSIIRLIVAEVVHRPEIAHFIYQHGTRHLLGFLYQYFARQVELGLMKPLDPAVLTKTFLGPYITHIITLDILALPTEFAPPEEVFIQQSLEIFLAGVRPTA